MMNSSCLGPDYINQKASSISIGSNNNISQLKTFKYELMDICEPINYYDYIIIQKEKQMAIKFWDFQNLKPGAVSIDRGFRAVGCLFQLLPLEFRGRQEGCKIAKGDKLYLRHVETSLFLSFRENKICGDNVEMKENFDENCLFEIEVEKDEEIRTQTNLKLKSVKADLYLKIYIQSEQEPKQGSIWLSKTAQTFKILTLNKPSPRYLSNYDHVILTKTIQKQKIYIGVQKQEPIFETYEQQFQCLRLNTKIKKDYFSCRNCSLKFLGENDAQKISALNYIWRIEKDFQNSEDLEHLVKSRENVRIRHVETGLLLILNIEEQFDLVEFQDFELSLSNDQNYSSRFSQQHKIHPLFIDKLIKFNEFQKHMIKFQKITKNLHLDLYLSNYLTLLSNLKEFMRLPKLLSNNRQQLLENIKYYIFVYGYFQNNYEDIVDGGFYFFEMTLKIVELLKQMLKDEVSDGEDPDRQIRKKILQPLTIEMLKFMSLIVATNPTFFKISTSDQHKTQQIIKIIFSLIYFNQQETLNLLRVLSKYDPELVVKLLTERILVNHNLFENWKMLEVVAEILDCFDRLNLNEGVIIHVLGKLYKVNFYNGVSITSGTKKYSLGEMFKRLLTSKNQQSTSSQQKQYQNQYYYQYLILVKVVKIFYNTNDIMKKVSEISPLTSFQTSEMMVKNMSQCVESFDDLTVKGLIVNFINQIYFDLFGGNIVVAEKECYIIYDKRELTGQTDLKTILTMRAISEKDSLLFFKPIFLKLVHQTTTQNFQKKFSLISKLKYFIQLLRGLTFFLQISQISLKQLTQIQQYGLQIVFLYFRDKFQRNCIFQVTRKQICGYLNKKSFVIIDGVKEYLDCLARQLQEMFRVIFKIRQRLLAYPYVDKQLFQMQKFIQKYTKLLMNNTVRTHFMSLQKLLSLYKGTHPTKNTPIFTIDNLSHTPSTFPNLFHTIIQDIYCVFMITQTYNIYTDRNLKNNLITAMKLKVLNIESHIKMVCQIDGYQKYMEGVGLMEYIGEIIVENYFEREITLPLVKVISDREIYCEGFFEVIKSKKVEFLGLCQNFKKQQLLQDFISKQLEHCQNSSTSSFQFIYEYLLNSPAPNQSLLNLTCILHRHNFSTPQKQKQLYYKLINSETMRQFIQACKTFRSFLKFKEKLQQKKNFIKFQQLEIYLHVIAIICEDCQPLRQHFSKCIKIQEFTRNLCQLGFYGVAKLFLEFIIFKQENCIAMELQFCHNHLKNFNKKFDELEYYNKKVEKKQNKTEYPIQKSKSNKSSIMKSDYWQFLYLEKHHNEYSGLLIYLEKIIKHSFGESLNSFEYNLIKNIYEVLNDILAIKPQEYLSSCLRQLQEQVNKLVIMIECRYKKLRQLSSSSQAGRLRVKEKLFKILEDNNLLAKFVQYFIHKSPKNYNNSQFGTSNNTKKKSSNRSIKIVRLSQKKSQSDSCSHHSLIIPESQSNLAQNIHVTTGLISNQLRNMLLYIEAQLPFKNRLMKKIQMQLLHFFNEEGSTNQLINFFINELQYKRTFSIQQNENLDYQIQYLRKSQTKIKIYYKSLESEQYMLQDLKESLKNDKFEQIQQIIDQKKDKFEVLNDSVFNMIDLFEEIVHLEKWTFTEVQSRIELCSKLIKYVNEIRKLNQVSSKDCRFIKNTKQLFLKFIFQISILSEDPTFSKEEISNFFLKALQIAAYYSFELIEELNPELFQFIYEKLLKGLQEKDYYQGHIVLLSGISKLNFQNKKCDKVQQLQKLNHFILQNIKKIKQINLESQNLSFYQYINLLKSIFNYLSTLSIEFDLQILEFILSKQVFEEIVKMQIFLHHFIKKRAQDERTNLFQSLVIHSISFFHNLKNAGKVQNRALLNERNQYLNKLDIDQGLIAHIYEYYEQIFGFIILINSKQKKYIQAFIKQEYSQGWKDEFIDLFRYFKSDQEKKQAIFSYSLLHVQRQSLVQKASEGLYKSRYVLASSSFISIILCIILTFFTDEYIIITTLFLSLNLIFQLLLICQKVLMFMEIDSLAKSMDKKLGQYYFFKSNGVFIILCLFVVACNFVAFFNYSFIGTLWLIFAIYQHRSLKKFVRDISKKIGHLTVTLLFCLSIILTYYLIVFNNFKNGQIEHNSFYITRFFWYDSYIGDSKVYVYFLIERLFEIYLIAVIIFMYIKRFFFDEKKQENCQLCSTLSEQNLKKIENIQKHRNEEHNIYHIISCISYVLKLNENYASCIENQIKKDVMNQNLKIVKK